MYYMEVIFKMNKMLDDIDFIDSNCSAVMIHIKNWQNLYFLW